MKKKRGKGKKREAGGGQEGHILGRRGTERGAQKRGSGHRKGAYFGERKKGWDGKKGWPLRKIKKRWVGRFISREKKGRGGKVGEEEERMGG